jgi:hypothetical protein
LKAKDWTALRAPPRRCVMKPAIAAFRIQVEIAVPSQFEFETEIEFDLNLICSI